MSKEFLIQSSIVRVSRGTCDVACSNLGLKLHVIPFILMLLTVGVTSPSCDQDMGANLDDPNDEKILLGRIVEFNEAFRDGNVELLRVMVSDGYLHTNGDSKAIGKAAWLRYLEKRKTEIDKGLLIVTKYDLSEVKFEIYNDMAVVTGKIDISETYLDENRNYGYRITNIWVKEEGIWKRAAFHDGRIQSL